MGRRLCPSTPTLEVPNVVLLRILALLPLPDRRRAAAVCGRWRACCRGAASGSLWEHVGVDFQAEVGSRRLNVGAVVAWLRGRPVRRLRLENSFKVRSRDVAPISMAIATATLHSTLEELYVCHCSNILGVRSLQALGDVLLNLRVLVVTGIRAPLRAGQTDFSPLSHLPQLQTLDISAEQRNASWGFVNLPSSWSTLAGTLRHLMLRSHDGLTSEGTQVVTSLTSMELLCIENCGLRGLPAGFHALSMLQRLVLNSTNVVGGGLRAIPRLPHLRELHLRSCPHLRQIPGEISQRKSLMVLTLGGGVEQQCVQWSDLTRLTLLRVLELDALGIKAVPKVLCSLQSLRLLSLRRNRFGPASLHNLSALSNLQYLCLSHCNLLEIPPALMHLKRMKIADLSSNPYLMIPAPVTWLASLHHLSRMDLRKSAQTSTGTVWDSLSAGHLIELVILMVMVRGNTARDIVRIV